MPSRPGRSAEFDRDLLAAAPKVRSYARHLAGQDAEDLIQDALVKALASADRFEPETQMAGWLRTVVRNAHLDDRRKAWRASPLEDAHAASLPAPGDQHTRLELAEVLAAIPHLPEGQRPLMEGAMLGYGMEELAAKRGCALGTVRSQLFNARTALRQKFG